VVHENKDVYLDESNVLGVAAEALPAAHQPILPDQSMRVATHPAAKNEQIWGQENNHMDTTTPVIAWYCSAKQANTQQQNAISKLAKAHSLIAS
jgi:hypothetical protein